MHTYEQGSVRFAIWVGPGRDPQVVYLDARQSVRTTTELGASGLLLYETGPSRNVLGGQRQGELHPAVLHRIVHVATDRNGVPSFHLATPCPHVSTSDGLCAAARSEPRPGTEAEPLGSLVLEAGFALQWVPWDDPFRAGVLRHAVYADDRHLLDAGTGPDGAVRAWPSSLLEPYDLELTAPSATELASIEERIALATAAANEH